MASRQDLTDRLPEDLDVVLAWVIAFADPLLTGLITEGRWGRGRQAWVR